MKQFFNKKFYIPALVVLVILFGLALKSNLDVVKEIKPASNVEEENTTDKTVSINKEPLSSNVSSPDIAFDKPVPNSAITEPETKPTNTNQQKDSISALSNSKAGWGLKTNNEHQQPEIPTSINSLLKKYKAYWIGNPEDKIVYLTFDEGYENGYTPKILDILKSNDVKAAFFVTGHYVKTQPDLVKRMVDEGHIVGNHTDSHPSMPDISDEQIKQELQIVENEYQNITDIKGMTYLRPPKGEYSERTLALTSEMGYSSIFWSIALVDWVPMPNGSDQAYQGVMDKLHNGAVILLHAISKDDTEALDKIIKDVKAQGYTFKTLDDLVKE
ncbi:peptidoglycan-N-acetylmuramic acid deacetylase [Desulfotomaculum arcticum]|uniref:Peptidoglycan-N-acetylmuramic acid deacetylase n=1 Tax=Desulfotruncus arcticus DSM 17038 TaxID=1121424 RepID=A0A1I2SKS2_9FIRM|nr:peptidoglycan-N-acetylmuramic acid deacetylase [Desulfotomaculum arcticum] [Desulfotruncus arcticus DSM 17038]